MSLQETSDWPLSLLVDSILGRLLATDPRRGSSDLTLTTGLANWYRLNAWVVENANSKDIVEKALSPAQQKSYRILWQWWTAAYQDPAVTLATILNIVSECQDLCDFEKWDAGLIQVWEVAIKHLQIRHWPKGDVKELTPYDGAGASYNDVMRQHWEWEFAAYASVPTYKESLEARGSIERSRLQAALTAFCQLTATSCYFNLSRKDNLDGSFDGHESLKVLKPASPVSHPADNFTAMSLFESCFTLDIQRGPEIEACQWLEVGRSEDNNLPYYLWDIVGQKTIETATLGYIPVYTAVSHTWGRWTTKTKAPLKLASVPWAIPRNSRFDVEKIPTLLAGIPTKTPFVWFDLVCIPQDYSPIATQEIARQAVIFKNAKFSVAWLNDIPNFQVLNFLMQWHVLQLLELPEQSPEEEHRQKLLTMAWEQLKGQRSGLLEFGDDNLNLDGAKPNAWFTSLWTLQEVSLRPDMWLCSRDWSYLTCDGIFALPFSGLITIQNECFRRTSIVDDLIPLYKSNEKPLVPDHLAIMELVSFRYLTGLDKLPTLTRAGILALGDRRECSERRAEAIMSVLGVTQWYELAASGPDRSKKAYEEHKDTLVLGKYPLMFVNELCSKIPDEFFNSLIKHNLEGEIERDHTRSSAGTMLPFGSEVFYFAQNPLGEIDLPLCHDSVPSWNITSSGAVNMPQVCLISSPMIAAAQTSVIPTILQPSVLQDFTIQKIGDPEVTRNLPSWADKLGWIDLHKWVRSQPYEVYFLVVTFTQFHPNRGTHYSGLVLKTLSLDMFSKIGNFWVAFHDELMLPGTTKVDWIVI